MPETPPAYPVDRAAGTRWAWLVVIASVLLVAIPPLFTRGEPRGPEPAGPLNPIHQLQARVLVGAGQLQPSAIEDQLPLLKSTLPTPHGQYLAAVVQAYLPGSNQLANAKAHLQDLPESDPIASHLRALLHAEPLPPAARDTLQTQLGWLAAAAESAPRPDSPAYREVIRTSQGIYFAYMLLLLLLFAVGCAGLLALIIGLVRLNRGHMRWHLANPLPGANLLFQAFAVYLGLMILLQVVNAWLDLPMAAGIALLFLPVAGGILWIFAHDIPLAQVARTLGLHRGRGLAREIACGLVGYIAVLPILGAGTLLTMLLVLVAQQAGWHMPPPTHPVVDWISQGSIWTRLLVLFLAAGMAPLLEETMFRGACYGGLRRRFRIPAAGLLSGLIFAAVHPQGILLIPPLAALGFGFALLREWRGSLIAPMVAHGLHNGMLVCALWTLS